MTSTSRFTVSPGCLMPSVVRARVSGISETVKLSSVTVDDGQRDAVDGDRPLVDEVAPHPVGQARPRRPPSARWGCGTGSSPVPSTWPWTMWPPSRFSAVTARSRLTRVPGRNAPREVLSSVSRITSAVKTSPSWLDDREAAAVDRDRVAVARVRDDERPAHAQAYGVALVLDGLDGAELLDDPGEHVQSLPLASGSVRGRISSRTLSSRTVTSSTRRCSASAIVVIPRSPTALRPAPRSMGAT